MNNQEKSALRDRAQQILKENAQKIALDGPDLMAHKDTTSILEEMRVYLAELEVQNHELRETQLALNQQQTQYKNLFDHLPIPAFLVNQNGIILQNNVEAELFLAERGTRHLQNHSIFRFVSDEGAQWLFSQFSDGLMTQSSAAYFEFLITKKTRPTKIVLMPLKKSLEKPPERQFIITLIDLTAEYQRQNQWRLFQDVLDHSSVAVYAYDLDGICLLANQKLAEILGYKDASECIGKSRSEIMSIRDANIQYKHDVDVINHKRGQQIHEEFCKDNQTLSFLTEKFPLFNQKGSIYAVGGIAYDITHQIAQEKQLALSNEIFTKGHDGIMICDPDARILAVNQAFEEITGYSEEECLQTNPRFLASGRHDEQFYKAFWNSINNFGYWRGEIWNRRKSGEIYPQQISVSAIKDAQGQLINYLGVFNDISEKKQAEEEVIRLAFYDGLTGVANRLLLRERTESLIVNFQRRTTPFSMMFIDLDHFKEVNDVHGHDMGDLLLIEVTERIRQIIRPQDTLARLGGDEFAVLFPELSNQHSTDLGERLVATLAEPYLIKNHRLHISASIGISIFPADARDYKTLLKHADLAMYYAKQNGRNSVYVFKNALETQLAHSVNIETELRYAIERNQLHLAFQPQFSIKQQRFVGIEALIRWQHPELGDVSPEVFIPLAERSDFIIELTNWVLTESLAYVVTLQEKGLEICLSVNISARELIRSDFVERITHHLAKHPSIAPQQLELEITERIAMEQPHKILLILTNLYQLGVSLALDDFGTGYSSLNYLKKYPLQTLKIDRSFVQDIGINSEDEAVCKAIISLAKAIGYQTIAEGVENEGQVRFLAEHGCDLIQGYFYAKPLDPEACLDHFLKHTST